MNDGIWVSHADLCRETGLKRPHATWKMDGLRGHFLPGFSIRNSGSLHLSVHINDMHIDRPLQFQGQDYDGPPYTGDTPPSRDHLYE